MGREDACANLSERGSVHCSKQGITARSLINRLCAAFASSSCRLGVDRIDAAKLKNRAWASCCGGLGGTGSPFPPVTFQCPGFGYPDQRSADGVAFDHRFAGARV